MYFLCNANRASLTAPGFALLVVGVLLVSTSAEAIERDFSIVTNQSSLAISGNVDGPLGNAPIQPQGTGSLSTSYAGTIKTDRLADSIAFLAGSTIDANSNGSWKPLTDGTDGSATADYGGKATFLFVVTVNFAGRNLIADLTSGALPIDSGGHFDLSTTNVTFASGDLAYRSSTGDPAGFASLAGQSDTLSGTGMWSSLLQGTQTIETLTLPVSSDFMLHPNDATTINLHLAGQLVAKSTFNTPLPGDYNQNGVVDAADYDVWRKNDGGSESLPNDETAGVGPDDYARWRGHFGQTSSGSGAAANLLTGAAMPEPASFALLAAAVVACGAVCRYR